MDFAESFEPDALTCIFNNEILFSCIESISGNPFNQAVCRDIYSEIIKYRAVYHKMPTSSELQEGVYNYLLNTKDSLFNSIEYSAIIAKLFLNKPNSNFTEQDVVSKLQHSLVVKAFEEYSIKNSEVSVVELRAKIDAVEALDTSSHSDVEEVSYTLDVNSRKAMYTDDINVAKVPTPWPQMNQYVRGGPGLGDACIVIGPTGRGKSTILAAMAADAITKGIGVLYLNLETSIIDTCEMLDAHFTGKERSEIRTQYTDAIDNMLKEVVGKAATSYGGKEICKIIAYPPNTITLSKIEDIIGNVGDSIHNFKLLIIDWGDCIKPARQFSERRHEYADVFHGIKALARKHKLVIWTATMGNKDSLNKKVTQLSDISESYAKAFMARFIITICQTTDEKNMVPGGFKYPIFRFWIAKNSKGPSEIEIPMRIDYGTVSIDYNEGWDDKMKEVYGFTKLKYPQKSTPKPFPSSGGNGKATKDILCGEDGYSKPKGFFKQWGKGGVSAD